MPSKIINRPTNGDAGMNTYLQQLLTASQNRDAAIERIATSVSHLSGDFNRKLDEAERDTRKQFESFGASVTNQFRDVTSKFEAALATRDAKLEAVSSEFLKSRQAPWAQLMALGMLMLAFGGSIGWLAYSPVTERTQKNEATMDKIIETIADNQLQITKFVAENFVSQREIEWRSTRNAEDRVRNDQVIERLSGRISELERLSRIRGDRFP